MVTNSALLDHCDDPTLLRAYNSAAAAALPTAPIVRSRLNSRELGKIPEVAAGSAQLCNMRD